MACVNKNLPIFQRLEAKFGFAVAEALSKQMGDTPTIEKAFKYIREIKMNKAQDVMDYLASGPIYEKSILMSKLIGVIHSYEGGLYVTTGLPETTLMEGKPLVDMDAKEISIKYPILFANLTLLERVMEAYPGLISYSPTNNGRAYAASINPKYLSDLQQEMEERDEILQSPNTEDAVEIDEEELSYDDAIEYFTYDEPFAFIEEGLKKITPIKKGVSELFESTPELASIGTPQQYSAYLDTIFPDSKVKDIVYHGAKTKFDKFDLSRSGENLAAWGEIKKSINFTNKYSIADTYSKAFSTGENTLELAMADFEENPGRINPDGKTINRKYVEEEILKDNPSKTRRAFKQDSEGNFILDDKGQKQWDEERKYTKKEWEEIIDRTVAFNQKYLDMLNNIGANVIAAIVNIKNPTIIDYSGKVKDAVFYKILNESKGDGFIAKDLDDWGVGDNIRVFEPEQIHILGSKQDIEGFKKFVKEGDTKSIVQSQAQSNKSELKSVNLQLSLPFDQIVDGLEFLSPENKKDLKEAIDEGDVPLICDL